MNRNLPPHPFTQINTKVPLQGAELEDFLQKEKVAKEQETARKAAQARKQRILEADEDDSESDSDSDSDDENEVERALGEHGMDTSEDRQEATDEFTTEKTKRKRSKRDDPDSADWGGIGLDDEGITKQMLSYDIYLKGNVSKATSFFKTQGGQTQRFRMFPYVEKKRRVDEYGETLDVGMWLRKGKALEEDAESEEVKEAKRRKAEEETKVTICLLLYSNYTYAYSYARLASGTAIEICNHPCRCSVSLSTPICRS